MKKLLLVLSTIALLSCHECDEAEFKPLRTLDDNVENEVRLYNSTAKATFFRIFGNECGSESELYTIEAYSTVVIDYDCTMGDTYNNYLINVSMNGNSPLLFNFTRDHVGVQTFTIEY